MTVGDVLVDLVLGVRGTGIFRGLDQVSETEEIGDVACCDGDGEAIAEDEYISQWDLQASGKKIVETQSML